MLNEVSVRKNATKKIAGILKKGGVFFEWERDVIFGDGGLHPVIDIIERDEFEGWFKKRYGVMKIKVFYQNGEMIKAVFGGEYWYCDRIVIKFKNESFNSNKEGLGIPSGKIYDFCSFVKKRNLR